MDGWAGARGGAPVGGGGGTELFRLDARERTEEKQKPTREGLFHYTVCLILARVRPRYIDPSFLPSCLRRRPRADGSFQWPVADT